MNFTVRNRYMLWRKLRNVLMVVRQLRYRLRHSQMQSDSDSRADEESIEITYQEEENDLGVGDICSLDQGVAKNHDDDMQFAGELTTDAISGHLPEK